MYVCMHECICVCVYIYICIARIAHTHTRTYTHTHTHKHTHWHVSRACSVWVRVCVCVCARARVLPAAKRLVFMGEFACILLHIWHTCILWLAATSLVPLCSQYMCSLCRMCSLYLRLLLIQLCSLNMCPLYMCALCRMCSLYLLAVRTSEPCSLRFRLSTLRVWGLGFHTIQPELTLNPNTLNVYPKPQHPQP